jgi:6-phosphofructokinase 2
MRTRQDVAEGANPPVAILTLNPALDVSYEVDRLLPDHKTHATHVRYDPGGNGINVARMLRILGVPSESFCLVAGEIGFFLRRLLADSVDRCHCFEVPGETRVNCTLIQERPRAQYEVTARGPQVPRSMLDEVAERFLKAAGRGFGVITGSLPPGVPNEVYASLVAKLRRQGARAVVDAQPPVLEAAVRGKPFLIKPNRYELESLGTTPPPNEGDIVHKAREVQRGGVDWVCVSRGAEGAVLVGADTVCSVAAPPIAVRSTVGAGDAMLAGLIAGFVGGREPSETLRLGVACGSATAGRPGTMMGGMTEIQRMIASAVTRTLS